MMTHPPRREAAAPAPLLEYMMRLTGLGAEVRLHRATELSCVLTAQLIRLLAFQQTDIIGPADVVITADVDAFITGAEILRPLQRSASVWLWRYELSYVNGWVAII